MPSSTDNMKQVIKTPRGIRFDCSGCGNCCLQWPVPLTEHDVKSISEREPGKPVYRRLSTSSSGRQLFTSTLEKRADGRCVFLTQDNRCQLHEQYGQAAKPSMCSLFPYTFSLTPEGVCASLSFASTAVLFNTGKLLSEQLPLLSEKFEIFQALFPELDMDWNTAQLIDGIPLPPKNSLALQQDFSHIMLHGVNEAVTEEQVPAGMSEKLRKLARRAAMELPSLSDAEKAPRLEARPKIVDQLLLKYLDILYFPDDVFTEDTFDLQINNLMKELIAAPDTVLLANRRFKDFINLKLGNLDKPLSDILDRFLYCRIFSWLYFGPGFYHLSLLAGINHLIHLETLIRLRLKYILLSTGKDTLNQFDLAEVIRTLERRLTQLQLSTNSRAGMEVLLTSLERVERLEFLSR